MTLMTEPSWNSFQEMPIWNEVICLDAHIPLDKEPQKKKKRKEEEEKKERQASNNTGIQPAKRLFLMNTKNKVNIAQFLISTLQAGKKRIPLRMQR